MKFYYNIMDGFKDPTKYYNEVTIRRFRVYEATPETDKAAMEDNSELWPVYDPYGRSSTEPVECKDIEEAYKYILEAENMSVYEYVNDI